MYISDITKTYSNTKVIERVSLSLKQGSVHGILGANGAGKSTLIKAILGFIQPDKAPETGNIPLKAAAFVPEQAFLPDNLSAMQFVQHACRLHGSDNAADFLSLVRLNKNYWNKPIRSYSKGMKQRTSIAFALAQKCKWLIMDEPLSGLDVLGRRHILSVLTKLKGEGMGIFICSHNVPDLVRICDHISLMVKGKIAHQTDVVDHSIEEAVALEDLLFSLNREAT